MKTRFHIEITRNALEKYFSPNALQRIIRANILQDRIKYQFGHDYIHFDSSAFIEGFDYIFEQLTKVYESVKNNEYQPAWKSLGRILHSWQDFYSHSNYVYLWLDKTSDPKPQHIDYDDQKIFTSPVLQSGKNYGIIEFIALVPGISILVKPFMPADSHAVMNLDCLKSGQAFQFAYHAAKKRTENVVKDIIAHLENKKVDNEKIKAFLGK
jgi:hypothetical protein